jgi:hypothetical protein
MGEWGVAIFLFDVESSSFCYLMLHAKIQKPRTTPSGRKVSESEDSRVEKIIILIVATMFAWQPFCNASGQPCTPLGPRYHDMENRRPFSEFLSSES